VAKIFAHPAGTEENEYCTCLQHYRFSIMKVQML